MIFVTVGTQFPFNRLINAIDKFVGEGKIQETIFAQIGDGATLPKNFESVSSLGKVDFDAKIEAASAVISHAGMGSIMMSFQYGKPLLVLPRLSRFNEVVNDHQVGIARKFSEAGHLLMSNDESEMYNEIQKLKDFIPTPRENQINLVTERVKRFLETGV